MKVDKPHRKRINRTVIIVLIISLVVLMGLGVYYGEWASNNEPEPTGTEDVFEENH